MKGKIVIKLDEYLKKHNISRSSVVRNGELRYEYCFKLL